MNHQGVACESLQDEGTTNVTAVEEAEDDPSKAGKNGQQGGRRESFTRLLHIFFLGPSRAME